MVLGAYAPLVIAAVGSVSPVVYRRGGHGGFGQVAPVTDLPFIVIVGAYGADQAGSRRRR